MGFNVAAKCCFEFIYKSDFIDPFTSSFEYLRYPFYNSFNPLCMRLYSFLFLLCIFMVHCNQSEKLIVKKYTEGKKLEEYSVDESGKKHGLLKSYHDNGNIREESQYEHGKLNGVRKIFDSDGTLEIEETYRDDVMDGPYTVYYRNGQAEIKTHYTEGTLTGILTKFYENGVTMEEVTFVDNIENGPFKEYYETGEIQWEGSYLNGDNEFGLLIQYEKSGEIIKKMMCDSLAICQTIWTKEKGDIEPKKILIK